MTFDDDFIQIQFLTGPRRMPCLKNGLEWPPPLTVDLNGFLYDRVSISAITDEQRGRMTHVMRGALYHPRKDQTNDKA